MQLTAEREGQTQLINGSVKNFEDAANIVEAMEDHETWPEGFDAVLRDDNENAWMYVDGWEVL